MQIKIAILALSFMGCTKVQGAASPAMQAEGAYGADINRCPVVSKTKLESKACECRADIRWEVKVKPNACDEFEEMRKKMQEGESK